MASRTPHCQGLPLTVIGFSSAFFLVLILLRARRPRTWLLDLVLIENIVFMTVDVVGYSQLFPAVDQLGTPS